MRAVVQKNGILRSRPIIPVWAVDVIFEIDDDFIVPSQVLSLMNDAGRIAGVGDWRPAKKGRYGRYKVIETKPAEMRLAA